MVDLEGAFGLHFQRVMRFLIALLFLHLPTAGAAGAEGILTSQEFQRCLENSNPTGIRLTEQIMADERADLRSAHRSELEVEKLRCVYAALEAYSFGRGLSVGGVEAVRDYRMAISQLALFSGSKRFELESLEGAQVCDQSILEEKELCLKALRVHLVQGRATVDAVDDFVAGYAEAIERQPKLLMNRLELQVEKIIRERVASTPIPAALR
jgi:hypothetical protein